MYGPCIFGQQELRRGERGNLDVRGRGIDEGNKGEGGEAWRVGVEADAFNGHT